MTLPFLKMNGLGNDFVVLDARRREIPLTPQAVKILADRRRGIGCDTLVLVTETSGADAAVTFFNADGSESAACGNASRCVANLVAAETGKSALILRTRDRDLFCRILPDGRVTVDMGEPKFDWQDIPLAERMDTRNLDIKLGPIDAPVLFGPSAVNMGNPHCLFFVKDVHAHDLEKIGPLIEAHPLFPERANISLVEVKAGDRIRQRVWERGVGITLACGTGACAAVAGAARRRLTGRHVLVELDGGILEIDWREENGHILMTGPAELNFRGEWPGEMAAP
ncbi:MAG: diaminopimelate epimerase [Alphaproteobacteria bacterium]|nr:diaminopimelate epimerase [Alphaproteobacteria bacterium]